MFACGGYALSYASCPDSSDSSDNIPGIHEREAIAYMHVIRSTKVRYDRGERANLEKPCVLCGGHYHGVLLAFAFFSFDLQAS